MIILGILGLLLFIMLGEYYNVVYLIFLFILFLKEWFFIIFIFLLMLVLGIGGGLVVILKVINYLFKNYREFILFFIEGIIIFFII